MDALNDIQRFLFKVNLMRERQTLYFAQRNDTNLRMAKAAEHEVDVAIKELKKKGYQGIAPDNTIQQRFFM